MKQINEKEFLSRLNDAGVNVDSPDVQNAAGNLQYWYVLNDEWVSRHVVTDSPVFASGTYYWLGKNTIK